MSKNSNKDKNKNKNETSNEEETGTQSKGNSGNTNGGTETSFRNTPQAKDDEISNESLGELDYDNLIFTLDILDNDLGGNGKSFWSIDDGINDSGAMDGYVAGDLLTQDVAGDSEELASGAVLTVTSDGEVSFDASALEDTIIELPEGESISDEFIYAIRLGNGTLSWAGAGFTITGINDAPTLEDETISTTEDEASDALDLTELGDDVDSDDDGDSLDYEILDVDGDGDASINGDKELVFDPNGEFEYLPQGGEAEVEVAIQATDSHGATADATVTVTIEGVNDAPTLDSAEMAAVEDGDPVELELADLADDVDDGAVLGFDVDDPEEGSASVNGSTLTFTPGNDFQELAQGETTDVVLDVTVEDEFDATDENIVTVTVTGVNDEPTLADDDLSTGEDGPEVSLDLSGLGSDIDSDDDGSSLDYTLLNSAPGGIASISGTDLLVDPDGDFENLPVGESATFDLEVQATDSWGETGVGTISVTINGANDDPTLSGATMGATEDGVAVDLDLSALGDDIDDDNDGSTLSYSVGTASEGNASVSGTTLSFDPAGDFQALAQDEPTEVTLSVTAEDDHGATANADVLVTVVGTNDAPTMGDGDLSADEDGAAVSLSLAPLGDDIDSDDDGSTLNYSLSNDALIPGGSVSVTGTELEFNPGSDFQSLGVNDSETFSVDVVATDAHGATATGSVEVTVAGSNDPVEISGGKTEGSVTVSSSGAVFTVEQYLGFRSQSLSDLENYAANNTADYVVAASVIDYTDDPGGFAGELPGSNPWPAAAATNASGTGGINDNFFARITANVLITEADTYTFRTFNDDGVFLRVNEQLVIEDITIAPEAPFEGDIYLTPGVYPLELFFFEYGGEASLELSLKNSSGEFQLVTSVDATGDSGTLNFSDVDLTDTHTVDVESDEGVQGTLTAVITTDTTGTGTGGVVTWNYSVDAEVYQGLGEGETATETFTVIVDDGNGSSAEETVTITINGTNDAPDAVNDDAETDEDTSVSIAVLDNDTDPDDGDSQTLVSAADGQNGSVSIVGDELVYTPNANFNGTDSFSYTMQDSGGLTSTATVNVVVNPVNDPAELDAATVDLEETDAPLSTGGTLGITDVDGTAEEAFVPQTNVSGDNGSFTIDAGGNWSWTANSALDFLEPGEEVSEDFIVTSVDGTETSVTINITGTADGPTAVNDSASLTASSASGDTDNTVFWVDWTGVTFVSQTPGRDAVYNIEGEIVLPDRTIDVTYTGQSTITVTQISGGTDYYVTKNGGFGGPVVSTEGVGVYTSTEVPNGPSNNDLIALNHADSARNLTFSEPIENLFFAIVSMNNNGYLFDQEFSVVSSADGGGNDSGFWGYTAGYDVTDEGGGQFGISTANYNPSEFHGVLAIDNALESLTWTSQADEPWNGFTLGTYGVASSATVSGNVIGNDDQGGAPPAEVTNVGGSPMVGNSVTLNLGSGAILKVDKDGDYLYDDNNAFGNLAAGQEVTDTVIYTIEDTLGNDSSAELSITVTGVNDAPVAGDDTASTDEDTPLSIAIADLLSNDDDIDAGDTPVFDSVQGATNGTVSVSGGNIIFTPDADFFGDASFTYTIKDGAGLESTATVDVTVNSVPDIFTVPGNIVSNGSFESALSPANDWTAVSIDRVSNSLWDAAEGIHSIDLNGFNPGSITQTLDTESGTEYSVFFQLSKNYDGSGTIPSATLNVIAGSSNGLFTFAEANTPTNMLWRGETLGFTADSASTSLSFISLTSDPTNLAKGPAVDDVVVLANTVINDFNKANGDVLDLNGLLSSIGAPTDNSAFNDYLQFVQSGGNTLVNVDPNGGADDYITAVTLVGVTLSDLDTSNYSL